MIDVDKLEDFIKKIRIGGDPTLWVVFAGLAAISLLVIYSSTEIGRASCRERVCLYV